jgi:hypothetical protein
VESVEALATGAGGLLLLLLRQQLVVDDEPIRVDVAFALDERLAAERHGEGQPGAAGRRWLLLCQRRLREGPPRRLGRAEEEKEKSLTSCMMKDR